MEPEYPGKDEASDQDLQSWVADALGPDAPADERAQLEGLLAAAAAAATPTEQNAGLVAALRVHASVVAPAAVRAPSVRRWALGAAAALVLVGSGSVAAYANVLPPVLQDLAHTVIGAPATAERVVAPGSAPTQRGNPADAPGSSLLPSSPPTSSPGGPNGVVVPGPNGNGTGKPSVKPTPQGTGKPSVKPTPQGTGKPSVKPTPKGTGKPSVKPTPKGTGKPSVKATPKGNAGTAGVANTGSSGSSGNNG